MANTYDTAPKNFASGAEKSITKYLDLAGLTSFWGRVKAYVDTQDEKLKTALNTKVNTTDTTLRSYIESLTVNGVEVTPSASGEGGKNDSLAVTIDGSHIVVGGTPSGTNENNYKEATVAAAVHGLDERLDSLESTVKEGVVNSLTITEAHDEYKYSSDGVAVDDVVVSAWVDVEVTGGPTGDIAVKFDDTAITDRFDRMDDQITELIANAGVTNIAIDDKGTTEGSGRKNLVTIDLSSSKSSQNVEEGYGGDKSGRGDVLISLDETALDEALDGIDTAVANEAASRKLDVEKLAGAGYTAGVDGAVGSWATTPKYATIVGLSERLVAIDQNLVTKIEEQGSVENYVSLDVVSTKAEGTEETSDASVTIKIDDTALADKLNEVDGNLKKLDDASVNGKALFAVTESEGTITVAGQQVVLTTEDINRPSNDSLEDTLEGYDTKIAALATAVNFRGVVILGEGQTYEDGKTTALAKIVENGDFIIIGDKEYVYYDETQEGVFTEGYTKDIQYFVELGDTTVENQRISALENWVDTNFITADEIKALNAVGGDDVWTGPDFNLD